MRSGHDSIKVILSLASSWQLAILPHVLPTLRDEGLRKARVNTVTESAARTTVHRVNYFRTSRVKHSTALLPPGKKKK